MRMTELRALAREHRLRGYSQLRKAELIELLQDNEHQAQRQQRPPRSGAPLGGLHCHPHRCLLGNQIDLPRCLLGNQVDLHRCLLGNRNVNRKMKSDNPS